ncbi:MAG: tyrosine-type recombinase/integrase [Lachnospiraceae bacterium]|nr:tyrosine-type recombinase/integrase [Lachnospiraceae bacterium]
MIQKEWDMQSLSDAFLQSVRRYGIKEVSMGQYEVVCKKIVHFSSGHGFCAYYAGLKTDYDAFIDAKVHDKSICYEYGRFQHHVIRMMASLAETGKTDFSGCFNPPKRYTVSDQSEKLIEKILDYHSLRGESKTEMSTVMRHFFKYAEDKSRTADVKVTDDLLMDFFMKELPKTNKGSMGRSLRAIKYLSAYLKNNGNADLLLDFTQLTARGHHIRVIPPYSQNEINRAVSSIDTTTPEGLRDYAIMLLAFNTGLRSVDIRSLCLQDIDWNKGLLYLAQSKTGIPLILPLSGQVMNAIADYILIGRPECSYDEMFLTVKGPVRPMNKKHGAFSNLCDKYFNAADVDKVPGRSFHSLRRSFATELSEAGVPLETISQMLGHKSIGEDKPYLSYNREQIAFCAIGFDEIPVTHGIYAGGGRNDNK